MNETEWWVSTKDFLPNIGERVLIISKFGNISDATLANYGFDRPALFSPDGYVPGVDVKWWMTIPTDGWSDITEVKPKEGEAALTMGRYGSIYSGVWKRFFPISEPEFLPHVWEVLFWRPLPELPEGVRLSWQ